MSNSNDSDNSYIYLNSLISINLISDLNSFSNYSKYIVRLENSDDLLSLKLCKKPLEDYIELTESLFFIRDIEECESIYDKKDDNNENTEISFKETRFVKKDTINQNSFFYLQHMISRKFVSSQIIPNSNKITLTLVNEIENAYQFSFKIINETRSSSKILSFDQIFYININHNYSNEEKQGYFVYEDELITDKIDNNKKYFDLILHKKALSKFILINQNMMITNLNNIYSGQLINIIFSYNINGKC